MKDIRFSISLYIIIPVIFAGIAVISILGGYQLAVYFMNQGGDPYRPVLFFGLFMTSLTFILGLLIAKLLLGPVERFVHQTEQLGVLNTIGSEPEQPVAAKDDMGRYTYVFDRVTEFLGRVEAQKMFPQIIGQSKSMRGIFNQILRVAGTDSTVLILGDTGTGKELIARSIHEHSRKSGKPFVAINCAAIPAGLLESELFGHERGAFTGADARKLGKFELANNGTIFLDEIGDMPIETQAKILRVLQESQIERVGGIGPIKVNVRVIAATNKDLSKIVDEGLFRQDLYFRLNVFAIHLPPLRNRKEDIPLLVQEFIHRAGKSQEISPEALQILSGYSWPGNVRELRNVIESASVLADEMIEPPHLPMNLSNGWGVSTTGTTPPVSANGEAGDLPDLNHRLQEMEKGMIIEALKRTAGVQVKAAKLLGIKERSLWHRIKKLEIDAKSFKGET